MILPFLYSLRDAGELDQIGRGLYRLADLPPLSNPDLVVVARKIPQAVVCLISALAWFLFVSACIGMAWTNRMPDIDSPAERDLRANG